MDRFNYLRIAGNKFCQFDHYWIHSGSYRSQNKPLFFRQKWTDERLAFNKGNNDVNEAKVRDPDAKMSVDASFVDQIWRPDVFFVDSREQNRHSVVTDNRMLDIQE